MENENKDYGYRRQGQLGWELNRQGKQQGLDFVAADQPDFDTTD